MKFALAAATLGFLGTVSASAIPNESNARVPAVDKINVNGDSRIQVRTASLNGQTYSYWDASSVGPSKGTIFMLHGFPGLAASWRYQVPALIQLGFRVIVPDLMGYGKTNAPEFSAPLYSYKRASDDMASLVRQLGLSKVIVVGHDLGGVAAYRVAQYHTNLISHIAVVGTPFTAASPTYATLEQLVQKLSFFGYQTSFRDLVPAKHIKTKDDMRRFLDAVYGGKTPDGKTALDPTKGVLYELLPQIQKSPLFTPEELEFFVNEYMRHGITPPLGWYRTRRQNYEDELSLVGKGISQPTLFIAANQDPVLKPILSRGMERSIPKLTRRAVDTEHFAMEQKPNEVNAILREWLQGVVLGGKDKL
ncbi:hypothetical protein LOZ39_001036 [Ophidiomyces ophidiicola]|nr:hypothetical protein LOZ49_002440 [Ophidiomyces ophidiicola]KAI2079730.1 hypothetical protein LOZ39_001036 [Ophidiomyces ophidiicola]KAI2140211.1 hypothetical protein LOZ29_002151 [Ophidiomyces ophidiicola]KAI2142158.1 hypothetical protein LOZ28_002271 [Ophidiomyces ophidiicola]KAI2214717.1 hypothetical protein LOZ15_004726 [Ophidiomyces ophidiicola]